MNSRMSIFVIALLSLVGCSNHEGDGSCVHTQSTYGYEYDQVSSTGLTLQATGNEYTFISFEEMEAEYIELEACVADNNTPGPIIIFTGFNEYFGPEFPLNLALYYYAIQTVFIDTDDEDWLPQRNCISDREFLRHEFTHHVLYLNGEEPGHANPKFEACEAFGYKTCNGEYCEE